MSTPDQYLIIKRGLYYMPDGQGYTGIRDNAGRYSFDDAKAHETPAEHGVEPISIVRLADAPEFSAKCWDDVARKHLAKQRDELRTQLQAGSALTGERRDEVAAILRTVAADGLPGPRDLDVALDAIESAITYSPNDERVPA